MQCAKSYSMHTKTKQYLCKKNEDPSILSPLKVEWQKSLVAPQDGMWETLTELATPWKIQHDNQTIGYACVDEENKLLQFFVLPHWMPASETIFRQFIEQEKIEKGLIGTNNPICLSIAMHVQKSVKVDTYLFTDYIKIEMVEKEGVFRMAAEGELKRLVDFYHTSMDGPKEWLTGYLGGHLAKGEIFILEEKEEILGACEVRRRESDPTLVDLGMVVSALHRKKGIGTYMLGKAKEVAYGWGKEPICSCEKDNMGSLKSIQKNGFRSIHQMLLMEF